MSPFDYKHRVIYKSKYKSRLKNTENKLKHYLDLSLRKQILVVKYET